MMLLTWVSSDIETKVVFDRPKVAISAGPLGTLAGVQLAAVFQSPEMGSRSQVALPARANSARKNIRPEAVSETKSLLVKTNSGFPVLR